MNKLERKILLCFPFFFFLIVINGYSQATISGNIKNEKGNPISGATVIITETTTDDILSFAISNSKGNFSIPVNNKLNTVQINVKLINYEYQKKEIQNKTQYLEFTLIPKTTELKEVIIKQSPIQKKGDTISYTVKSFADQKDRSIADVIAKMPGIEIQADGKILYQGKPIQKYYIEGMDLLEDKYNLANNNLPYQSVSSVQILENHQSIKVLDSLVTSNKTSLNIKLKKKITTTGIAKLGIGATPLLWDVNITPMLFKKKAQLILSYQANNVGKDVASEIKSLTIENIFEELENPTQKIDLLTIIPLQLPNISNKRYLNNNVNLLSANFLTKLKNDTELRFNASYLNDYQNQFGENITEFILPTGNQFLKETINNKVYTNDLQTNFTIQKNNSKKYLKNSFKTQINWENQKGNIKNNTENVSQNLQNPYYSITNQLKLIKTFGKQLFTLNSFVNLNRMPQNLMVYPGQFLNIINNGNPYNNLKQEIIKDVFQTNNYLEFTKGLKKYTISSKIGIQTENISIESNLFINQTTKVAQFENNQNTSNARFYFQPTINYKKNDWNINFQFPINYNILKINNAIFNETQTKNAITTNPNLYLKYEINSSFKTNLDLEFNNNFDNFEQINNGYILNTYRNFNKTNYPIAQNQNYKFTSGLEYRNPLKSIFFNFQYIYNKTQSQFLNQNTIEPNGLQINTIKNIENEINLHNINTKISKYYNSIKTTLTLGFNYNSQETNQLFGNQLLKITNQNTKPNFKINTRITTNFSLEYDIETNFSKTKTETLGDFKIFNLTEKLKINIYPRENQYVGFDFEHYYNDSSPVQKTNFYSDLIYRFTTSKKKIDLELKCTNIFNEKIYTNSIFDDFYLYQSSFTIRPRQLLASIKFNF